MRDGPGKEHWMDEQTHRGEVVAEVLMWKLAG